MLAEGTYEPVVFFIRNQPVARQVHHAAKGRGPVTTSHPIALWAMAWRARSTAWMIRNRRTLETALNRGAS